MLKFNTRWRHDVLKLHTWWRNSRLFFFDNPRISSFGHSYKTFRKFVKYRATLNLWYAWNLCVHNRHKYLSKNLQPCKLFFASRWTNTPTKFLATFHQILVAVNLYPIYETSFTEGWVYSGGSNNEHSNSEPIQNPKVLMFGFGMILY